MCIQNILLTINVIFSYLLAGSRYCCLSIKAQHVAEVLLATELQLQTVGMLLLSSAINSTNNKPSQESSSYLVKIVLIVVLVSVTAATVFGNTLIVLSYYRYSRLRTPSNTVILSLSVVDILLSIVFVMKIIIATRYPERVGGPCLVTSSVSDIIQCVMTFHFCLISFERFLAVRNSLTFPSIFTLRRVFLSISIIWSLGLFISLGLPELLAQADHQGNYRRLRKILHPCGTTEYLEAQVPELNALAFISLCLNQVFPFVFITGCYGYIVHVARRHRKQILAQGRVNRLKMEMKGTITAALVLGIFVVCFTPLAVVTLCRVTNPPKFGTYYWARVTQGFYLLANSCAFLNPAVYAWRTEAFRRAFVKILSRSNRRVVQQHI